MDTIRINLEIEGTHEDIVNSLKELIEILENGKDLPYNHSVMVGEGIVDFEKIN